MKIFNYAFILLLLLVSMHVKSQTVDRESYSTTEASLQTSNVPEVFYGAFGYNLNDPELVVDTRINIGSMEHIDFNIPFASPMSVEGNHIYFRISKEEFMSRVYKVHAADGFWDIQFSIYYEASFYERVLSKYGILRIVFHQ